MRKRTALSGLTFKREFNVEVDRFVRLDYQEESLDRECTGTACLILENDFVRTYRLALLGSHMEVAWKRVGLPGLASERSLYRSVPVRLAWLRNRDLNG